MGCQKISYYEQGEELEKNLFFSGEAYEKRATASKNYLNYYPFGLQHANSWTRPTDLKNNFLYNAGAELNEQTHNYETFYRDYDPALGRFNQIDPLASSFSSWNPYQYAFNDPVALNDPMGDAPDRGGYDHYLNDVFMEGDRFTALKASDSNPHLGSDGGRFSVGSSWGNGLAFGGWTGGGYYHKQLGEFGSFLGDLFAASRNGISYFSGNDVRTSFGIWSSLSSGESFALNYGSNGSVSFDAYRFTAGGNNSGYSSVELKGSLSLAQPNKIDLTGSADEILNGSIAWASFLELGAYVRQPNDGRKNNFFNVHDMISKLPKDDIAHGGIMSTISKSLETSDGIKFHYTLQGASEFNDSKYYSSYDITGITGHVDRIAKSLSIRFDERRDYRGTTITPFGISIYGGSKSYESYGKKVFKNNWIFVK